MRHVLLALVALFPVASSVLAESPDPPVAPGRDGGGTPVAIVGAGVNYTKEAVAGRLARDGEGEIIGYDFADDDRRPYATRQDVNETAEIVLGEGQATSIIPIRFDPTNVLSFGKALSYAGKCPAKIILAEAELDDDKAAAMLASAARYFRDRLFVVPAGDKALDLDGILSSITRDVPNLLVVTGASQTGVLSPVANRGAVSVDLATDGRILENPAAETGAEGAPVSSSRAAARIAALAARLLAVEPFIAGAALKARIAGLARPIQGVSQKTHFGLLERPARHFWLE